jgi:RNA polymerase sigma factor (sigma-70 family)
MSDATDFDATAFDPAELERHRAFLQRLARALVRGEAAAEDLVQEAFARALERPPVAGRALRPWLGRVLRHLASNRARGAARTRAREQLVARGEAVPPPDEALASLELHERLVAALKALDEPYRTTLWLRFHEGLSPGAVAARQQVPPKTVEARITRGLERLRAELDRRSGGDRARWLGAVAVLGTRGASGPAALVGVSAMNKLAVVLVLLVALVLGWRLAMPRSPGAPHPADVAAEPGPSSALLPVAAGEREELAPPAAPVAPVAPSTGTLALRVLWSDGTPAPGIGLFVFPEDDPRGERGFVGLTSDGDGRARVENCHAGSVRVEADRGAVQSGRVRAGEESELVLTLPDGVDVFGSVTDAAGAPVVGAEILLVSPRRDWLTARVVGRSGANGAYEVRAAGEELAVSARAERYVPAFLRPLTSEDHSAAHPRRVRADLVLDWMDHALRGIVRDPGGRPVAGALVAAGSNRGQGYGDSTGGTRHRLGMPVVRTDAAGRFEAFGIEHLGMPVAVMAEGFPIQVAEFPGWNDVTTFAELVLEAPATVTGTVRDAEGAPVAGAVVSARAVHGRAASAIPFPLPRASTGEDGRFTLELLPSGAAPLRVAPPSGSALAAASREVVLAAGESLELELVLPAEPTIRGRALDAAGAPLAGARIDVQAEGSSNLEHVNADDEGRFTIDDCTEPPYEISLIEPGGWRRLVQRNGLSPGADEIELVLPALGRVTGVFLGRTDDATSGVAATREARQRGRPYIAGATSGKPFAGVTDRAGEANAAAVWDGDAFTCEGVLPGTYRLTIRTLETQLHRSDWFEVRPGETVDLGLVAGPEEVAPGSLALVLSPQPGANVSAVVRGSDFDVLSFVRAEGELWRAKELPPGRYFADVRAEGWADACVPFEVVSGEEARLELALERGTARTLSFTSSAPWKELRVSVRTADGRLVVARRLTAGMDPPVILALLPAGELRVEAVSDTGLAAGGALTVHAGLEQDSPLVFELR